MKQVIYNGGTESYKSCSDPTELVVGNVYEVVSEYEHRFQTNYKLKGIEGSFNSVWFDELPKAYLAVSRCVPVVGSRYKCIRMIQDGNSFAGQSCTTSTVEAVEIVGQNTYKVVTANSVYLVSVIS